MPSLLSNTEELLLLCAQGDLTRSQKEKAQTLIKEGVDWGRFLGAAMEGRVCVSVYNAFSGIDPFLPIPQSVLDRLKSARLFIIAKTTYQHTELLNLLRLFMESKIPVIPLKGAILARRLYGDIAGRDLSTDHDFLVEEENKKSARILLEKAGYSFRPVKHIIKPWQSSFVKPKAMAVDLHWDITKMGRSKKRIAELWRGVRLVEEDGISYYEFKEEELLLYLSAQMLGNCCFTRLKYVCDIHQLLHRSKDMLNWSEIVEKARRWRLSNSLYAAVKLSRELFNSDSPPEALKRLKPHPLKVILLNLFVNKKVVLRNKSLSRQLLDTFLRYIFFELIEAESVKDCFFIVFPSRADRDKDWAARIAKGVGILSRILPQR